MKALRIILMALAFISLQAHAEDEPAATRSVANETFEQAKKAADQGDAVAQYKLGLRYVDGRGVAKDAAEAAKWFRKAADQGNAEGQFELGYLYEIGKGVAKSEAEAAKWYQKSATLGNTDAMRRLDIATAQSRAEAELSRKGKILSSLDAGMYTYIELTENGKTIWIAAPTIQVKKGDTIRFSEGAVMSNYYSKSLNRTFESVIFVGRAAVAN